MSNEHCYPISDWDSAYQNASHIADADSYIQRWQEAGARYRQQLLAAGRAQLDIRYDSRERNTLDLFLPEGTAKGLVVFVHGGYWTMLDKNSWSHLASGSLAAGYAVAIPSYSLCPAVKIADIVQEIASAITLAASKISGEIRLVGHSAGGDLVTSMLCDNSPLADIVQQRIVKTVSISGVHDLRPLLNTQLNETLQLDWQQAVNLSPILRAPKHLAPLTCWVGAEERPEFLRLNRLQADIWKSFGIATNAVEEPARHHFNVVDGLMKQQHPLMQSLLGISE